MRSAGSGGATLSALAQAQGLSRYPAQYTVWGQGPGAPPVIFRALAGPRYTQYTLRSSNTTGNQVTTSRPVAHFGPAAKIATPAPGSAPQQTKRWDMSNQRLFPLLVSELGYFLSEEDKKGFVIERRGVEQGVVTKRLTVTRNDAGYSCLVEMVLPDSSHHEASADLSFAAWEGLRCCVRHVIPYSCGFFHLDLAHITADGTGGGGFQGGGFQGGGPQGGGSGLGEDGM